MDPAKFRREVDTRIGRLEDLLRDAARSPEAPERLVIRALQEVGACVGAMRAADEEIERLNGELVHACGAADSEHGRYRRFFLSAHEPCLFTCREGLIGEANGAAGELLAVAPQHLAGKPLALFVAASDRSRFRGLLRAAKHLQRFTGRQTEIRCHTITRDRRFHCGLSVEATGDRDDRHESLRWSLRDLTEGERALERDVLADETHRKDEFLAALGHELRNPLAALTLAAERMTREAEEDQRVEARQSASIIVRHARHLTRLVDDLLDAARIRHGKIELRVRPVELSEVVTHAIQTVEPAIGRKNQHLELRRSGGPLWVRGDADRLHQVMVNLLDNASKYTDGGGQIQVSLGTTPRAALVSVRDNGIGIAPSMLDSIFGLFEQVARRPTHGETGLGLGLSLVREIVHLHGGEVRALSDGAGRGSEFLVTLPACDEAEVRSADESGELTAVGPSARVLVADDNVDAAEILGLTLSRLGHEVLVATSGREAIDRTVEGSPSVALVDLDMPDVDGFEVARRIVELRPATVLVAVTGFGDPVTRRRARDSGFRHYLLKPIDVTAVDRVLRGEVVRR